MLFSLKVPDGPAMSCPQKSNTMFCVILNVWITNHIYSRGVISSSSKIYFLVQSAREAAREGGFGEWGVRGSGQAEGTSLCVEILLKPRARIWWHRLGEKIQDF